jgi:energy-coupling factor transport system substrate-specific component
MAVPSVAAIASMVASLIMDIYKGYIEDLAFWNLSLLIGARLIGSVLIAGVFAHYLVKALESTGVADFLRPVSQKDYESLD